jgi:hypothetical protein
MSDVLCPEGLEKKIIDKPAIPGGQAKVKYHPKKTGWSNLVTILV